MMVPVATDHETLLCNARQQDTAKAQIISGSFGDVRYWHKADMTKVFGNVRFRG
jgi:hypothetical protein